MGRRRMTGRGPMAAVYACRKSRREKEQSQPGQSGTKTEKRGARAGRARHTYVYAHRACGRALHRARRAAPRALGPSPTRPRGCGGGVLRRNLIDISICSPDHLRRCMSRSSNSRRHGLVPTRARACSSGHTQPAPCLTRRLPSSRSLSTVRASRDLP